MTGKRLYLLSILTALAISLAPGLSEAKVSVQCPGDVNGDAIPDQFIGNQPNPEFRPNVKCRHLTAGDGFIKMGDGSPMYTFGFKDVTGTPVDQVMSVGMLGANFPAPTIAVDEGDEFYLTLTNVGMMMRPDLFDPHSVHWHGFPQAASIFDGVPEASVAINMGSSLTYYYNVVEPGTFMYHCHVEATEHMQMGMLGNLYVRPKQDKLPNNTNLNGFIHNTGFKYAYNDGDGSTYYDVDYPIQLGSLDPVFHDASLNIQPLPFTLMKDKYAVINGRGYPDTVNPNSLVPPAENNGQNSQNVSSLITAARGQKILLRLSNLSVTRFYTIATTGLPMKMVGLNAKHLKGSAGQNLYYNTGSITLGGGESADVIIDTANLQPGSYFLYTTNLNYLNNNEEDFGGMMTEIIINPAA
ncbi:MAG: multicopper oxidase domain-containing protein [Deltaproteobacteria bacterium]|nr:multicopper oxidase domain-containing protein [Deltaproteobacteria bacterium]